MIALRQWPTLLLWPAKADWNIVGQTLGGGMAGTISPITRLDGGGFWGLSFSNVGIFDEQHRRIWKSIRTICDGGVQPIVVNHHKSEDVPWPMLLSAAELLTTKSMLNFDGVDGSLFIRDETGKVWNTSGAQIDTVNKKFGTGALLLNGSGDYVATLAHADFNLSNSNFKIQGWFYCTEPAGTGRALCGQRDAAGTVASVSHQIYRSSTGEIVAEVAVGGVLTSVIGTTVFTDLLNIGWHKFEFVRSGNFLKLFIDGVQEGGNVAFSGTVNNSAEWLSVGRIGAFPGLDWKGSIDAFKLNVGGALWTSDFISPDSVGTEELTGFDPVPHSDGAYFSDGSGYETNIIEANLVSAAALRATEITVDMFVGSAFQGGEKFSIDHEYFRWRLYEVSTVLQNENGTWTLQIRPPLRAAITTDTYLDFDRPKCVMRLKEPGGMAVEFEGLEMAAPSVEFIEAFPPFPV